LAAATSPPTTTPLGLCLLPVTVPLSRTSSTGAIAASHRSTGSSASSSSACIVATAGCAAAAAAATAAAAAVAPVAWGVGTAAAPALPCCLCPSATATSALLLLLLLLLAAASVLLAARPTRHTCPACRRWRASIGGCNRPGDTLEVLLWPPAAAPGTTRAPSTSPVLLCAAPTATSRGPSLWATPAALLGPTHPPPSATTTPALPATPLAPIHSRAVGRAHASRAVVTGRLVHPPPGAHAVRGPPAPRLLLALLPHAALLAPLLLLALTLRCSIAGTIQPQDVVGEVRCCVAAAAGAVPAPAVGPAPATLTPGTNALLLLLLGWEGPLVEGLGCDG
jgi:hypothetical protein